MRLKFVDMQEHLLKPVTLLLCLMFIGQSLVVVADKTHLFDHQHNHSHVHLQNLKVQSTGCDHFTSLGVRQSYVVHQHQMPCERESHHCHIDHVENGPIAVLGAVEHDWDVFDLVKLCEIRGPGVDELPQLQMIELEGLGPPVKLSQARCLSSVVLIV